MDILTFWGFMLVYRYSGYSRISDYTGIQVYKYTDIQFLDMNRSE